MAKSLVFDQNDASDHLKTWILKVYIHCEGCKKKVIKILQSIDGVYKTVIDAKDHKVTVTGSVNGETLVNKLLKSGKHAEILPETFEATPPKKKKQSNKQKDDVPNGDDVDEEKEKSEVAKTDGGNDEEVEGEPPVDDANNENNGGKKKKKKKSKGDKDENTAPESAVAIEKVGPEEVNLGPPLNYATSYDMIPPYTNSYYPNPAYGMSYNTSYPSTESSYYTPPMYGYAQSHPHMPVYYPPPPPSYYRRSVFDDHDVENEGRLCTIM